MKRVYDRKAIQEFHSAGHGFVECQRTFGFSHTAWIKAIKRGEIVARPRTDWAHAERSKHSGPRQRGHVKSRLLNAGILKNKCVICGIEEWRGHALSMHIDHINGIKDDHRLENLRMLCPNCHSQTPTYGGRNAKRQVQRL